MYSVCIFILPLEFGQQWNQDFGVDFPSLSSFLVGYLIFFPTDFIKLKTVVIREGLCFPKIHQFIVVEICSDRSQHNDRESISLLRHRSFPSCLRFPFILWIIVQWFALHARLHGRGTDILFHSTLFVKQGGKRNIVKVEKFELAFSSSWSLRKCDILIVWARLSSEKIYNTR